MSCLIVLRIQQYHFNFPELSRISIESELLFRQGSSNLRLDKVNRAATLSDVQQHPSFCRLCNPGLRAFEQNQRNRPVLAPIFRTVWPFCVVVVVTQVERCTIRATPPRDRGGSRPLQGLSVAALVMHGGRPEPLVQFVRGGQAWSTTSALPR